MISEQLTKSIFCVFVAIVHWTVVTAQRDERLSIRYSLPITFLFLCFCVYYLYLYLVTSRAKQNDSVIL